MASIIDGMRRTIIPLLFPWLFVGSLLLTGCANHFDPEYQLTHKIDRQLTSHTLAIKLDHDEPLDKPELTITVTEAKRFQVTEYEGMARYDVYTPYQGWREAYEIPVGILTLPFAIILSIVPSTETPAVLSWSVAGMNPFLNVEDKDRSVRKLLDQDIKPIDEKQEYFEAPLANTAISLQLGDHTVSTSLDDEGKVKLNLLDYVDTKKPFDNLVVSIALDDVKKIRQVAISHHLTTLAQRAHLKSKSAQASVP